MSLRNARCNDKNDKDTVAHMGAGISLASVPGSI